MLFNKESELVIRLQDMGNSFAKVNKKTNKIKAQQQTAKSSFHKRNYDLTKENIKNVNNGVKNGFEKRNFKRMERVYC